MTILAPDLRHLSIDTERIAEEAESPGRMRRTWRAEPLAPAGDAGGRLDGPPCQRIHLAENDRPPGKPIHDTEPRTAAMLATQLQAAGSIVRNGAGRIFEFGAFCHGTGDLSRAIEDHPAFNIAGGGNTLAAICRNGMEDRIDNNSTGAVPSSACAKARRCRTSRS